MSRRPIAISDSKNFYVSAERMFERSIVNVPVIVLSNNDGCAVARSDEAKALGIKMGEPLHLIRDKIERHGVRVFSSNYTVYADLSRRVVDTYEDFTPQVEIYSIDECFRDFGGFRDHEAHAPARAGWGSPRRARCSRRTPRRQRHRRQGSGLAPSRPPG